MLEWAIYNGVMKLRVNYGENRTFDLNVPDDALVAEYGRPLGEPLDDPAAALAAALMDPIDFPPIVDLTVSGDQVAIPLDPGLPQAPALVAGLVQSLCEAGTDAGNITVVWTREDVAAGREDPRSGLPESVAAEVQLVVHDDSDRDKLAYLATSSENKPFYISRVLQDADVVLPIGVLRVDSAIAYHGIHGVIFPNYSDAETIRRYRAPSIEDSDVQRRRRCKEAEEVARLLGILASIQVVPAAGDGILHILAGSVAGVWKEGRELCELAWRYEVPRRAKLVVAGIEGDAACQTWENVARAVTSALNVVDADGVIAVCSELATKPGKALRQLAFVEDYETAMHEIRRERSVDAVPAAQLLKAMDQSRIFLLSRLDADIVEELGIAPVSNEAEIARLSSRFESCIVLSNAQYAEATAAY